MSDPKTASFLGHLRELRTRLVISLVGVVLFSILGWFLFPWFHDALRTTLGEDLYLSRISEGFSLRFSISLILGLVLASPLILQQLLGFILPALNGTEKAWLFLVLGVSSLLLFLGVFYGFKLILPISVDFLKSSDFTPEGVQRIIGYSEYVEFFLQFLLAFGISFELPIFIVLLIRFRVVSVGIFVKQSKWIVVGIFIVAAIITPPDVTSQLAVALPMVVLYYAALLVGWMIRPRGDDVRYRVG